MRSRTLRGILLLVGTLAPESWPPNDMVVIALRCCNLQAPGRQWCALVAPSVDRHGGGIMIWAFKKRAVQPAGEPPSVDPGLPDGLFLGRGGRSCPGWAGSSSSASWSVRAAEGAGRGWGIRRPLRRSRSPEIPNSSYSVRSRDMCLGVTPRMSAACSHVMRFSSAFWITSTLVIVFASRATSCS
jgi:hypothetical protein